MSKNITTRAVVASKALAGGEACQGMAHRKARTGGGPHLTIGAGTSPHSQEGPIKPSLHKPCLQEHRKARTNGEDGNATGAGADP